MGEIIDKVLKKGGFREMETRGGYRNRTNPLVSTAQN